VLLFEEALFKVILGKNRRKITGVNG